MSYMGVPTLSYTLRIPVYLKRLLESSAASGGVSMASLVIEACWKHLDRSPKPMVGVMARESIPAAKMNPAMTEFFSRIQDGSSDPEPGIRQESCPKTGYNEQDGETYGCCLEKGHRPPCRPGKRI